MKERFSVEENNKLEKLHNDWDLGEYEKYLDTLYVKYGIYGIMGEPKQDKNGAVVGDVHDMSRNEQLEYARRFGEGSNELSSLLLELWKLGIETRGACSGITNEHRNSQSGYFPEPYFAITVTDERKDIIEKFISELKKLDSFDSGCIEITRNTSGKFGDSISFRKRTTRSEIDAFFHVFREAI